jgi:hypothetical protein
MTTGAKKSALRAMKRQARLSSACAKFGLETSTSSAPSAQRTGASASIWKSSVRLFSVLHVLLGILNSFFFPFGSLGLTYAVPHPVGAASHSRRKDRMSYSHEEFIIDLTQVTSNMPNTPVGPLVYFILLCYDIGTDVIKPKILHELELEFARHDLLVMTAAKRGDVNLPEHDRSAFDELIRAFVNNARILVRNSNEGWQQ